MKLILAGGFLGSGKTTAIVHACQLLMAEGKRVALITNDQGDQQVDSAFAKSLGISTREVSNGCFCCRYDELDSQLKSLQEEQKPDIVFAESVGSCTDIIATVARPLLHYKSDINIVVSVFADVDMLVSLIEGRASFLEESVRYIYKKQLEEADLVILNKVDLITKQQLAVADDVLRNEYPGKTIVYQNSFRRDDIVAWLDLLDQLTGHQDRDSLTIDYDVYGEGEAKLAWLDKSIIIQSPLGNGGFVARQIIRSIFNQLKQQQLTIGHLKFFVETDAWSDKISFTTASTSADVKIPQENIQHLKVLINARIQTDPSTLKVLIDKVLADVQSSEACAIVTERHAAFKPGFPRPTHRIV
jgi:Ni2+-binding GTPase involved in maturation of urease and hydrogenase